MKNIGIIGCGTIGKAIVRFIRHNLKDNFRIIALCDIDTKKAEALTRKISPKPIITDIDDLIKRSDFIIESASADISGVITEKAIGEKKDVLVMSTGGLLNKGHLLKDAKLKGCNVYIPTGAICGLDGLTSAMMGKVTDVILTTRKPLKALAGAAYFKNKKIGKLKKETLLYSGNAYGAIKYFPQNINVSATLSLLGIGPRRTKVRIVTSPSYTKNIHEVEVKGEFGKIVTKVENLPSQDNPKTSQLAIFSALAKLKEIV